MDAVDLLQQQLKVTHGVIRATAADISPSEWSAAPFPQANPPGFLAWHMVATQDWALHTWLRGLPDVRSRLALPGIDPMHGPFGMTATEAAAIARVVTPVVIGKYADAVLASGLEWLQTLAAADMDAIPASRAHLQHVPAAHKTESYLAEVEGMYDYPVWRIISGPCFGHPREHGGELRTMLAMMRAS
jgi:hypothetical protein